MLTKVAANIWKFTGTDKVNIYYLDLDKKMIIDTGYRSDRQLIKQFLGGLVKFEEIEIVVFTHLHHDHIGNFDFFPNAEFYASAEEIADFQKDKEGAVLEDDILQKFVSSGIQLKPLQEEINGLKVIKTPGHTRGSVCLWYAPEKILFSGDTLFPHKQVGRTDLPNSAPSELHGSIMQLLEYNFKILCPGHDY